MPYDLSKPLVIGISSRALFNLEQENKIFEEQGVEAYEAYQVAHENEILQKGAAFQLIKAFLELNNTELGRLVEVIIMSRNNANTCLRIFNSIHEIIFNVQFSRYHITCCASYFEKSLRDSRYFYRNASPLSVF